MPPRAHVNIDHREALKEFFDDKVIVWHSRLNRYTIQRRSLEGSALLTRHLGAAMQYQAYYQDSLERMGHCQAMADYYEARRKALGV